MPHILKMKELISELNKASALYYNTGMSFLTDKEFDEKYRALQKLEEISGVCLSNSPTVTVGAEVLDDIPKINLTDNLPPMLSLAKVHSQEEIESFTNGKEVLRMIKVDGLSVRIHYSNGTIAWASTRGNGTIGSDITNHIKHFLNVPLTIPYTGEYTIDGEAVIKLGHFEIINQEENSYKNPRNLAAGTLNLLDMSTVASRGLSFIAWDIIQGDDEPYLNERFENAERMGFETVYYSLDASNEDVLHMANSLGIPNDGVVWKFNDIEYGRSLGRTSHHFNSGIAWKPQDESASTKLLGIEWGMGRTGKLTPVAIFEPVELEGTTVNRASLHNLTIMYDLLGEPYFGQEIEVVKCNQIIPQIVQSIKKDWLVDNTDIKLIPIPKICPVCGAPTASSKEAESETLICTNSECSGKLINRINHFVSKKGLDIKGLSKTTLEKLIEFNWLTNITDLYYLKEYRADWINSVGFGKKSVDNILEAIEESRNVKLESFIAAIGIPHIGNTLAKEICKYVDSYEDFREKVKEKWNFSSINGIALEKSYAILTFDYTEADNLAKEMRSWTNIAQAVAENVLDGYNIVITGKLFNFANREELKSTIESLGGKVVGSVSKNTTILINNDIESNSSKNIKAKELNIPIITEEEFITKFLTL